MAPAGQEPPSGRVQLRPADSGLAQALADRGARLLAAGQVVQAVSALQHAVRLAPHLAGAQHALGQALLDAGRLDEAANHLLTAATTGLAQPATLYALATTFHRQARDREAMTFIEAAAAAGASEPAADLLESAILLRLGRPQEGWARREARLLLGGHDTAGWDNGRPRWHAGTDTADQTIVLYADGSLSEAVMFARYARAVHARGAQVVLAAPPGLGRLLATVPGVAQAIEAGQELPGFDMICPLASLAFECGSLPAESLYVAADRALVTRWQGRLGSRAGLRVGLAHGGGSPGKPPHAVPLDLLRRLLQVPSVTFHTLQAEMAEFVTEAKGVVDTAFYLPDLDETAALMANLDLVITADTVIAHLAAAMGIPTWVLLARAPEPHWQLERQDSDWYPTVRLFRQGADGAWERPVEAAEAALLASAQRHAPLSG
jgi:tetratricopeptide (TPR) repeat protein